MTLRKVFLVALLCHVCHTEIEYRIPEVILEAYSPSGFRASIRAEPGVEKFRFHGNLNKKIEQTELGEITGEVKASQPSQEAFITFLQPQLKLKKGDVINYWVYVQHNSFGYRKFEQTWEVKNLRSQTESQCSASASMISGKTKVCVGETLFEENFDQNMLDETKWLWEQYLPDDPDYEFVQYKKDVDVTLVEENRLSIKPKLVDPGEVTKKFLDLTKGCTRETADCTRNLLVIHNPVISGRIVSKVSFAYGEFEIRAKLPAGDWLFPEIYLEGENNQKLLIAYARGNEILKSNEGEDIGATCLYGGPVLDPREPKRSEKLLKRIETTPFTNDFHTYKIIWTPKQIEMFVDGTNYGKVDSQSITPSSFAGDSPNQVRLVLGVGVGGVNDFPDKSQSGKYNKPWKNLSRSMVRSFYDKRDEWFNGTWNSNSQLQVDYVKVKSV